MRSPVFTASSRAGAAAIVEIANRAPPKKRASIGIFLWGIIPGPLDTAAQRNMIPLEVVMALNDTVRAVLDHKGVGVCAVMPETPVYEALEIMADKDIGAVLVMEDADLCGIFSERDYARKVILQGKASRETTVGEIMKSPPVVAPLDQSVDDCLCLMTDRHIRHLPV